MIGLGVVQHFDPKASLYLGFRRSELDIGISNVGRTSLTSLPKRTLNTVMFGFSYHF